MTSSAMGEKAAAPRSSAWPFLAGVAVASAVFLGFLLHRTRQENDALRASMAERDAKPPVVAATAAPSGSATLEEMAARMEAKFRDDPAAPDDATEKRLRAALTTLEGPAKLDSVECRMTICKGRFRGQARLIDETIGALFTPMNAKKKPAFGPASFMVPARERLADGTQVASVYFGANESVRAVAP